MKKEQLRMQMLAGIITEGQYKQKLLNELQYFHNGAEMNQIINYDDSNITDDLEFLGQGSMDGQDFTPGNTYNIGGQKYKVEAQGDEFKLVLAEALNESITSDEFEEIIDRYEEEVTEESDDFDDIGRMVSERAEMEIQKEYPNITVDYSPAMDSQQNQKRLYSAYDKEEEETVAEYYFEP